MKKFNLYLPLLFVFTLIIVACATPPTEEMNRAHDAVIRAENDADAVTYAPNTLIRARDALVRMQAEAEAKRYDAARNFASEAISNAERAITEGRSGAGRARDEAIRLIDSLAGPLAETETAVFAAREQALLLDFNALGSEMDLARRTYEDARRDLQAANFPDAIARGQLVRSYLSAINAQLSGAAHAIARK
jgi:hypothetical protein